MNKKVETSRNPPISKEKFLKIISQLQACWDIDMAVHRMGYDNMLNIDLDTYALGGIVTDLLTVLLEKNYDDINGEFFGDIYFFCNDLDFGRKWEPGSVTETDENDNVIDIDFSSAEKLWDYLIETYWSKKDE